jgi:hypothetical protein
MTFPAEVSRTARLLEEFACVEVTHLGPDLLEVVGKHLSYVVTLVDGALWLFARRADSNDELRGLLQTSPTTSGWTFVRRLIYGCEHDGIEEITLPLELEACPAPCAEFLVEEGQ